MENQPDLYAAFIAKDTRFDGRIFVGISSTGIYCRPICRAKNPKPENCHFYATAAEAEQAGYRPCMLCRPELAPGTSVTDAAATLAANAARLIEENCSQGLNIQEISATLGCSDRHLRRVFTKEYQVSPVHYLQTCRLLLAKSLLTDTNLPVIEVAMAAGFGSLRRFNDLFVNHYRQTPSSLRKGTTAPKKAITLALGYRPPYEWHRILNFLAQRAINGVALVQDDHYLRTVQLENLQGKRQTGWLKVGHQPQNQALTVEISESLLPVLPQVLARVRQLFDLTCDPKSVDETLEAMNELQSELYVSGTRLPGCFDPFEMAVCAILEQQITVKGASTLAARLTAQFGLPLHTEIEGLTHLFPTADDLLAMDNLPDRLSALGIIATRAQTITALAQAVKDRQISFDFPCQPIEEMQKLMRIKGIGAWTAHYIIMRGMSWPDAFLETDLGIKKALQPYTKESFATLAEAWKPWRSYAVINLWNTL